MPNIHEYKNDPGYFIYAQPPDVGNVTYGIDESAYPVFDELGYEDGDSISWRIIQVLKYTGLEDTEGEGTTPDTDPITVNKEDDPTTTDRERFFELVMDIADLPDEETITVREMLELEPVNESNTIEDHWNSIVEKRLQTQLKKSISDMDTTHLLNGGENNQKSIAVLEFIDRGESDQDYAVILEDGSDIDDGTFVEYLITIESEKFIADINRQSTLSEASRTEAFGHIARISQVFCECDIWTGVKTPTIEIQF